MPIKINRGKCLWILYLSQIILLVSCGHPSPKELLETFPQTRSLATTGKPYVEDDSLTRVEGLACEGENLVVYDFCDGKCYALFDQPTGKFITRFGKIGQGPGEMPGFCQGYLFRKCFSVFNDQARIVMRYDLDSLRTHATGFRAQTLTKYNLPDAQLSRLIAIDDSTFFAGGLYKSRYQHFLFNNRNRVLEAGIEAYNSEDESFNMYNKFIANQGDMVMHPRGDKFAYAVNFSSNIDFSEISNGHITPIGSFRYGNPIWKPENSGGVCTVNPTEATIFGYLGLARSEQGVYALYSSRQLLSGASRCSNTILFFDWEGHPVMKYLLDRKAYYIAVDEKGSKLFAVVKNEERGWSIVCYDLS